MDKHSDKLHIYLRIPDLHSIINEVTYVSLLTKLNNKPPLAMRPEGINRK